MSDGQNGTVGELKSLKEIELDQSCAINGEVHLIVGALADPEPERVPQKEKGSAQMMTGRELVFALVISAFAGSLLLDLAWMSYALPSFLRPAKTEPRAADPPIMASVLNDMQSLGLVELTPDTDPKPTIQRPRLADDQHPGEMAAA